MIGLSYNNSYDTELLKLILEALRGVTFDGLTIKCNANKRTVTGSGVISGRKSVTFITHGTDCHIFSDLCEDGREYTFTAPNGSYLPTISYNAGTGSFEILTIS